MLKTHQYGTNIVPPIVNFGVKETVDTSMTVTSTVEGYDYETQTNVIPLFCGSDKYATYCAKNYGGIIFKDWRNVTDDAREK